MYIIQSVVLGPPLVCLIEGYQKVPQQYTLRNPLLNFTLKVVPHCLSELKMGLSNIFKDVRCRSSLDAINKAHCQRSAGDVQEPHLQIPRVLRINYRSDWPR
jgi:hypothetical protein